MSRNFALNTLTVVLTFLVGFAALELGLRWLVEPSPHSWGRLFGIELPPLKLAVDETVPEDWRDSWYDDLIVDGRRITYGDLWGGYRRDADLGYVPQENFLSANGWWQNNELGARSRKPTQQQIPAGHQRVLVFGESFGTGSRVPQESAWPNVIDLRPNGLDVVNFAVDGYSMGQSFLRYRSIRLQMDHDVVLLMFVPTEDLWRDVNTLRLLADPAWNSPPLPRLAIQDDSLIVVRYDGKVDDEDQIKLHAMRHDRFYCTFWDGGWFILSKLTVQLYCNLKKHWILWQLKNPDYEAMMLSARIFSAMEAEVVASERLFLLVILPTDQDLARLGSSTRAQAEWQQVVDASCAAVARCLDLSHDLLPRAATLDRGYDGTHYGPSANRLIAELIESRLLADLGQVTARRPRRG